jgi:formylglycine-generating enzyme required for sulfatase activity
VILICAEFGCSSRPSEQSISADAVDTHSVEISIGTEKAIFRKISPQVYQVDYPEFYLLETEVTNRMYREYLRSTGKRKDDTEVLEIVRDREQPLIIAHDEINDVTVDNKTPLDKVPVDNEVPADNDEWHDTGVGSGTISVKPWSTGDISYEINDETTIWRDENYPVGLDDHPVGLVTLPEAEAFCEWLSKTHPDKGLFRLPTWSEWMIAAYGSARAYPWGDEWHQSLTHTSFGCSWEEFKKRAEPVKARPLGRTPEGLYGMLGNVSEYLFAGDPTSNDYFNLGALDGRGLYGWCDFRRQSKGGIASTGLLGLQPPCGDAS